MNLSEIIKNRRSIYPKQMSGEIIPDSEIIEMLESANWAPTHKFTEPWRFKIFKEESKNKLVDFHKSMFISKNPGIEAEDKRLEKFEETKLKVSHIIAIVMKKEPIAQLPEMEEIAATAMAVQNLWLECSARGFGGYWSTGNGTFDPQMALFLNLGENETLMGYFYMGKPIPTLVGPGRRKPLSDKITWMD